jgi:hypothetical protein
MMDERRASVSGCVLRGLHCGFSSSVWHALAALWGSSVGERCGDDSAATSLHPLTLLGDDAVSRVIVGAAVCNHLLVFTVDALCEGRPSPARRVRRTVRGCAVTPCVCPTAATVAGDVRPSPLRSSTRLMCCSVLRCLTWSPVVRACEQGCPTTRKSRRWCVEGPHQGVGALTPSPLLACNAFSVCVAVWLCGCVGVWVCVWVGGWQGREVRSALGGLRLSAPYAVPALTVEDSWKSRSSIASTRASPLYGR